MFNLVDALRNLPEMIADAEEAVASAAKAVRDAEESLATKEAELVLQNQITGKNETERRAQLRSLTAEERRKVVEAQDSLTSARIHYNKLVNQFKAVRTLALLFSRDAEDVTVEKAAL